MSFYSRSLDYRDRITREKEEKKKNILSLRERERERVSHTSEKRGKNVSEMGFFFAG